MKILPKKPFNLREGGKREWEMTDEYGEKVRKIVQEVTHQFAPALLNERRWIKRLLLRYRRFREIEKRIDALSSPRNLHLTA